MLDLGAMSSFISLEFAKVHRFPLSPVDPPIQVETIDGTSIKSGPITHEAGDPWSLLVPKAQTPNRLVPA
ncbi:hypothetical protein BDF14DRAFT_1761068 [Spinellus fusiger]|nr:hypothetical protein BDF14DRAFT_1761068 [Spinellus fusiger]